MSFTRIGSDQLGAQHLDQMVQLRWQDPHGEGEHLIQGRLESIEHDRRGATVVVDVGGEDVSRVLWNGEGVQVLIAG